MKYRKAYMFLLRLVIGVILVILLWGAIIFTVPFCTQGPHEFHAYDIGNGYELLEGCIILRWVTDDSIKVLLDHDFVEEFTVTGHWLIGKTQEAWFAINKQTHQEHYPVSSAQEIQTLTDFNTSNIKFFTSNDFPPPPVFLSINEDKHEVIYFHPTRRSSNTSNAKDLTSKDLPLAHIFIFPWTKKAVTWTKICLLAFPVILAVLPNVWHLLRLLFKRLKIAVMKNNNAAINLK